MPFGPIAGGYREAMRERLAGLMPREQAYRLEESIFQASGNRVDYERMLHNALSSHHHHPPTAGANPAVSNGTVRLSDDEKQFVIGKLAPLQVHLPKMDKLLLLFQQHLAANPSVGEQLLTDDESTSNGGSSSAVSDVLRKYGGLRQMLHRQLELFSQDVYMLTPAQAVALVEHVHRLTNVLVQKARQFLQASGPPETPTDSLQAKFSLAPAAMGPVFAAPTLSRARLERDLHALMPTPLHTKVCQEGIAGEASVYCQLSESIIVHFRVSSGSDADDWNVDFAIFQGRRATKLPCQHAMIGAKPTMASLWRHIAYHLGNHES